MKIECAYCKNNFEGEGKGEFRKMGIVRIGRLWRCKTCKKNNKKDHREFLKRKILGIEKRSDLEKKWAAKREQREKEKKEKKDFAPIIPGSEVQEKKKNALFDRISRRGSWYIFGYLTRTEKQFLYNKYTTRKVNPLTIEEAKEKINKDVDFLAKFVKNMKKEKKPQEEIDTKFKEEFAKLIDV